MLLLTHPHRLLPTRRLRQEPASQARVTSLRRRATARLAVLPTRQRHLRTRLLLLLMAAVTRSALLRPRTLLRARHTRRLLLLSPRRRRTTLPRHRVVTAQRQAVLHPPSTRPHRRTTPRPLPRRRLTRRLLQPIRQRLLATMQTADTAPTVLPARATARRRRCTLQRAQLRIAIVQLVQRTVRTARLEVVPGVLSGVRLVRSTRQSKLYQPSACLCIRTNKPQLPTRRLGLLIEPSRNRGNITSSTHKGTTRQAAARRSKRSLD